MSPKFFVFLLVLGFLALSVQAGGKKHKGHSHESKEKSNESKSHHSKSHESKSKESKEHSKSHESKSKESKSNESKSKESKSNESKSSESKSEEDCKDTPVKPHKCGHNEEWVNCGTACPLTCDKPKAGLCIQKCVAGCQCKKGLLRNKWGKCVEACDC